MHALTKHNILEKVNSYYLFRKMRLSIYQYDMWFWVFREVVQRKKDFRNSQKIVFV